MKGRSKDLKAYGTQLDSLIDIISFGVLLAVILLRYGEFKLWFIPGAFVILATCAIRLSYFNIVGLIDSKTYLQNQPQNSEESGFMSLLPMFWYRPLFWNGH